jgi:hypothetical protein
LCQRHGHFFLDRVGLGDDPLDEFGDRAVVLGPAGVVVIGTVEMTLPPYARVSFTSQSPFPRAQLITGTFSSMRTRALS